jgi:anti-sigma-K factor RskA
MSEKLCDPFRENLAAYALGTLDAEEIPELESHLRNCQDCQLELASFQSVAGGLLGAILPKIPPEDLRRNLTAHLPSAKERKPGFIARILNPIYARQAAVAAVMCILLLVNLILSLQIRELQKSHAALAEKLARGQTAVAMLAYPDTQKLNIQADVENLAGTLLVDTDMKMAVLFLWNLPELPKSQIYQVWLIDENGQRISGGLFNADGERGYTTAIIRSSVPIGSFSGIGVTIEPEGGSDGPTGPRVLSVGL